MYQARNKDTVVDSTRWYESRFTAENRFWAKTDLCTWPDRQNNRFVVSDENVWFRFLFFTSSFNSTYFCVPETTRLENEFIARSFVQHVSARLSYIEFAPISDRCLQNRVFDKTGWYYSILERAVFRSSW
jgi:hypothetical protein